jgi:hypothetical protein
MTTSQHTGYPPTAAPRPALWRAIRRAAHALWTVHDEQMRMWECFWLAGRVPADQTGPLAWTPSLDGTRLTGSYLPGAGDDDAGGTS